MKHALEPLKNFRFKTLEGSPPVKAGKVVTRPKLSDLDPFHHPKVALALRTARKWAVHRKTHPEASLVLVATKGENRAETGRGCGKTYIGRCLIWCEAYFRDGKPHAPCGRFYQASDLIQRIHDGEPVDMALGTAPVVVIDDVGTERQLPYVATANQASEIQKIYYHIINSCYEGTNKRGVIITSNLSLSQLSAHVGSRAWSRLNEMAPKGFMLDLTGVPDYRLKKGGRS